MNNIAVDIENVSFRYSANATSTLSEINLKISEGESFGLFGPNGAGKTTLMSLMTGLISADKGSIKLLGRTIGTKKKIINRFFGFVPQDFSFYHELSTVENLEFFGAWAGLNSKEIKSRTEELLKILGLVDVKDKKVQNFSGGMKRRVNLAIGVIHKPQILFLDEPTVGVDVQARHAIIDYLKDINKQGTTLIYTSHLLSEAEELCDQIALIDNGKIIVQGDLKELIKKNGHENLENLFLDLTGKDYRN